ncbi:MAG: exonuclease SbcCD subunit D [Anaerolineales bacterium]|jgi:exonuclease SbcD
MKLLHFADAHIDMANYGRHDPESGLPLRVLDFLKSLDTIVETAIAEKVDLVIFAGDAYKDRSPAPTFQREWGRRIIRLSQARIPALLLVGNHDVSPAAGRAHAIHEFDTLQVPLVRVIGAPVFLKRQDLWDLPLQLIAWPWVSRSGIMAARGLSAVDPTDVNVQITDIIIEQTNEWLADADPDLPMVLTAHASVEGATFGSERTVMLGSDLILPASLVKDSRLDYVALGHIHKPQDLNRGAQPPVIYPGSIERVDFGEAGDDRFFVIADVARRQTRVTWKKLKEARRFIERRIALDPALASAEASSENIMQHLQSALPSPGELDDAIVKLTVEYPREYDALIDEPALRKYAANAFEFHLVRRPQIETRVRLPADQTVSSLSALELLEQYWRAAHVEPQEIEVLQKLASEILRADQEPNETA